MSTMCDNMAEPRRYLVKMHVTAEPEKMRLLRDILNETMDTIDADIDFYVFSPNGEEIPYGEEGVEGPITRLRRYSLELKKAGMTGYAMSIEDCARELMEERR